MKAYKLLIDDSGFKTGDLFYGPLPIANQMAKGYYSLEELKSAPSDQCFFASAVENNTDMWELVGNVPDPRTENTKQ